jgi:hypothetical protein
MIYTPDQICNLALARVGDDASQITSLPETVSSKYSKEANLCYKFYGVSLQEVLRMHTWNCAKKRAKLARLSTAPTFGFSYQYSLPVDCARPLELHSTSDTSRLIRYNVEWLVEGRNILSNIEDAWLLYVSNMADLTNADSLFIKVLYMTLAAKLAYPLTENRVLTNDLIQELESVVLPDARRVNSFEGRENPIIDSEWIEATYAGYSGAEINRMSFDLTGLDVTI